MDVNCRDCSQLEVGLWLLACGSTADQRLCLPLRLDISTKQFAADLLLIVVYVAHTTGTTVSSW